MALSTKDWFLKIVGVKGIGDEDETHSLWICLRAMAAAVFSWCSQRTNQVGILTSLTVKPDN